MGFGRVTGGLERSGEDSGIWNWVWHWDFKRRSREGEVLQAPGLQEPAVGEVRGQGEGGARPGVGCGFRGGGGGGISRPLLYFGLAGESGRGSPSVWGRGACISWSVAAVF